MSVSGLFVCQLTDEVEKKDYTFSDNNPQPGIGYYRLKMIGLDGTISYSQLISLISPEENIISIFPNPSSGRFNLNIKPDHAVAEIVVQDASGRPVECKMAGDQIDISESPPGYISSGPSCGMEVFRVAH